MKTVRLGNSGVEVSAFALGTMNMGSSTPESTSRDLLNVYWAAGGRLIDTANSYTRWAAGGTGGEAEELVGRWLAAHSDRDEAFVATKVGLDYQDVCWGLRPEVVVQEIDRSLRRLRRDHVDLYFAHVDDTEQALEVTVETFDRLVRSGKVRFWGISNYHVARIAECWYVAKTLGYTPFTVLQQRYAYLRMNSRTMESPSRRPQVNLETLLLCKAKEIPIMAYSPLAKGCYDNPCKQVPDDYAGEDTRERLKVLKQVAGEVGATPNQVALAWLTAKREPTILPLFAASSVDQLLENLGAARLALPSTVLKTLGEAGA